MQDATNLLGHLFEEVQVEERLGTWLSSVGEVIRCLRANSLDEHAEHFDQIVFELRQSVAASQPEAYREIELDALARIALSFALITKHRLFGLTREQHEYLNELLNSAIRMVNLALQTELVVRLEGIHASTSSDPYREVVSRWRVEKREALNAQLRQLEQRDHSVAAMVELQLNAPPTDSDHTYRVYKRPVIYHHGEMCYSLETGNQIPVSYESDNILQTFLEVGTAMNTRTLRDRSGVTNVPRAIRNLRVKYGGVFEPAVQHPGGKKCSCGYWIRVMSLKT